MRAAGYLYAVSALVAIGATLFWAVDSERPATVALLEVRDGQRYTPAPTDADGDLARCVACHAIDRAGPERSAPSLAGIVGAPVARSAWFGYSPALRRHGGVWDRARLEAFLTNPTATVPGTFKTLAGLPDAEARAAILDALGRL